MREVTVSINAKIKELSIKLNKESKSNFRPWPELKEISLKPCKYKYCIEFLKKIYRFQKTVKNFMEEIEAAQTRVIRKQSK